ncbi:MAG TPA: protein kinase [Bryobacteraceae bacterium]|nr:protein kinase [Bryobacteraceae bacterium]
MTREQWLQVRNVVEHALEVEPAERARFLDEACGSDTELRAEVESLLKAHEEASHGFLAGKAIDHLPRPLPDLDDSLRGRMIGSYQVLEEIGHGGMGTVYRAVRADDQYDKVVAIKVMRGAWGDRLAIQRFKAERQILANLDHADIARLLDGGATEDGRPYVVMEYIQGQPIDAYCDGRNLPLRERLNLFRTVCSAVAFAHQHLIVHRDIKPANILVTESGAPKLLDFGIAKIMDSVPAAPGSESTVTMLRLMTPEYASPEQVLGAPVTTATDVYSLGVVLYRLLTGRRPYPGTNSTAHEMAQAVLEVEPERPSSVVAGAEGRRLRGDLDNIVLKALRKEPERRYASVQQFSDDIAKHLAGQPVTARPDTLAYRSSKFVRRHRIAVLAAALALLALLGGLAATLREASIAREQRQRAEQRFNDVRKLANSMLFEVYDAVENLPGATPARKILVDRALQYLDKLAAEAKDDLSLQRELAAAYERVGDVQGGFRSSNLGDTAGFIASYRKALVIREAVAHADQANVEAQRELLRTHGRLSDALMSAGDLRGSVDQLKQLLPIAQKLSSTHPDNLADRRNLASAYLDYGWKRSGLDDFQGGLQDCRKAVAMLESISSAAPKDKRTARVLALAYGRVGELLSGEARQHEESLRMQEKALQIEQALLAQDPRNSDLRRMSAWDTMRAGEELLALGDGMQALDKYRQSLRAMQALSAADPKSVQYHSDVAAVLARIGAAHLAAGDTAAARSELERSLVEIETFSRVGALDIDTLQVRAEDQFRLGKVYGKMGDWRQAKAWFERALPGLEQINRNGAPHGEASAMLADARRQLTQLNRR